MNSNNTIFNWDEETGMASCILTDKKNNIFLGLAQCHPDDRDMMNQYTGQEIAYRRALLKALRFYKKNELTIKYQALYHYYNIINHSKYSNEQSYEVKMLKRQLTMLKEDINSMKEYIAEEQEKLNEFLRLKEEFYQHIRNNREVKILEEQHKKS